MMLLSLLVTHCVPTSLETPKTIFYFAGMTITSTNYMLGKACLLIAVVLTDSRQEQQTKASRNLCGYYCRKRMRGVITVVLNADHQDNNPYAFVLQPYLHSMDYISSHSLRKIVQKGDAYQDSKTLYKMEKRYGHCRCQKDDISLIERVGSQSSQSVQFTPDS